MAGRVADRVATNRRLHKGDRVSWRSHGSRAYGTVVGEITERTTLGGRTVNASREHPQYRIRNDHSGREVAHRPEALRDEPT